MRIDKTVGTKKNNKLDSPKEDKSFKKLSFLPNVTPIEKIKRKVHVREMISFPFFNFTFAHMNNYSFVLSIS